MNTSCSIIGCIVSIILIVLLAIFLCILVGTFGLFGSFDNLNFDFSGFEYNITAPTPEPNFIRPDLTEMQGADPVETLKTLTNTLIPENDPRELAMRLGGLAEIPETLPPPAPLELGTEQTFWVSNSDTSENFQVDAALRYITDHVYFWIETGVSYQDSELRDLVENFEQHTYPTVRNFFGSEWTPGIDGDPHLYILYVRGVGSSVAGYFSPMDEYHPLAHEYSNGHEMFILSADNTDLGDHLTGSVLAHEFQHMIHWYRDANEETWINEGFSELAAFLAGFNLGGFDWAYTQNPDIPLMNWPEIGTESPPYYGAAFLILDYFLNRYGETATKTLVSHPENGMTSIDLVLSETAPVDPLRGRKPNGDDVFQDWAVALYLQDSGVMDGRFNFDNYPNAPNPGETETISTCPTNNTELRGLNQYGIDYIRFKCKGTFTVHFDGSTIVPVISADAYSGSYAFWSNRGDVSDMTLTRNFDFSQHIGPLTLSYHLWYDIEEDFDYLYLEASTDQGATWEILTTPSGTNENPSGNSYGWGYNGVSNGWIKEQVDLSRFAGQHVMLRFEYITDAGVTGEGLLLDDVAVPEIGYFSDFETDAGGWEPAGFARIQNLLPQTFRLAVIQKGEHTTVSYISLSDENITEVPIHIGGEVDEVILVVIGTSRFSLLPTGYRFYITP